MNYINCIIRILEIPSQVFYFNKIPFIKVKAELVRIKNSQNIVIVFAKIWGDLGLDLINYYQVNNYLLIDGYISNESTFSNTTLTVFQIYPYFC